MAGKKVSLPKGMRDFGPQQVRKRQYILDTIREVFEIFGYQPIETPVMEQLSTLNGKGGAESDKLLFKVLNSGDFLKKADENALNEKASSKVIAQISEKGLRYDLTVPLARYVVMHQNDITFPFKRYQMQPVWRADRPQKGRYREFWQCDADVLGSESLINEMELIQIFERVFKTFNIPVKVHLSSRKLLAGMMELIGQEDKMIDFTVALDKLDKIGVEKVQDELRARGLNEKAVELIPSIAALSSEKDVMKSSFIAALEKTSNGAEGVREINTIMSRLDFACRSIIIIDPSLARGLDYYTGPIFEVKSELFKGSIGSGGRYDNLTGIFGLPNVSGVGISFGLDRIYDLMQEQNLFPDFSAASTKVLLTYFDEEKLPPLFGIVSMMREANIKAELYPAPVKLKKQFKYANDKGIPYVVLYGDEEADSGEFTIKDMEKGEQFKMDFEKLLEFLKQ